MRRFREPGSIEFERRRGGDRVLEPLGIRRRAGEREYIIACGMGNDTVYIKWYACDVHHARESFRLWLGETWQTLATDLQGYGIPNGMDFKPGKIDWFNIAGE